MRTALLAALGLTLATLGLPASGHHEPERQRVDRKARGWPVDGFALVDHRGGALGRERLLGSWTFVVFGNTSCSERCTAALAAMTTLSKRIGQTEVIRDTQVLFVSLDTQRDTPAQLAAFLAPYDARWVGATGSEEAVTHLASELGAAGRPVGSTVVLIGPEGDIRAEYLAPYDPLLITADYLKTRKCRGCGR